MRYLPLIRSSGVGNSETRGGVVPTPDGHEVNPSPSEPFLVVNHPIIGSVAGIPPRSTPSVSIAATEHYASGYNVTKSQGQRPDHPARQRLLFFSSSSSSLGFSSLLFFSHMPIIVLENTRNTLQGFLENISDRRCRFDKPTPSTRDPSLPAPSPRWTHWNVGDVYETRYAIPAHNNGRARGELFRYYWRWRWRTCVTSARAFPRVE